MCNLYAKYSNVSRQQSGWRLWESGGIPIMSDGEQMHKYFPISLAGLVATGVVFVLQVIPFTGIFLMFAFAMFWSVVLINASMIGVAIEALVGRVSRLWFLLPLVFYGGYWTVATLDHFALREIASRYDVSNARVVTGFDPVGQALVFEKDGDGAWLTQNFALPVAYSTNPNFPEGYLSNRMIESTVCTKVRESRALQAAFVHGLGFHDGDAIHDRRMETRFCNLSMPRKARASHRRCGTGGDEGFREKPAHHADHDDDSHARRPTFPTLRRSGRATQLDTYADHGMRPQFRSAKLGLQRGVRAKRFHPHCLRQHPI